MRSLAVVLVVALAATGCARFDDRLDAPFTPAAPAGMGAPPSSSPPEAAPPTPSTSQPGEPEEAPETGPCVDPDPAVIATCLEPVVAVAGVGERALVAEATGGVHIVTVDGEPEEFGRVDPGAGRVVALATSPTYEQDKLVYLLVVGDGPSRVERLARGDKSTTVAELAPATSGGLAFQHDTLTVGLDSELLAFPSFDGIGRAGDPEILARDVGEIQALCTLGDELYFSSVTDRGVVARTADMVIWTWPDQRAVGGCAATETSLSLAMPDAQRVDTLPMAGGASRGQPEPQAQDAYGRLTGLGVAGEGVLLAGTTNKAGGTPVQTDDRVVIIPDSGGGGSDARV